jgi:predicted unusual protein kinase regulating ubiquinone biosynthesis (AarF/ABC1/UbiB family)
VISFKPRQIRRYRDVARLLVKYGRSDLLKNSGLGDLPKEPESKSPEESRPSELAKDLEQLGPTFIKIGQLLSTRGDLLPVPYLDALSRLQDNIESVPFTEIASVVTSELGFRIANGFKSFEEHPIATASLGQVHRATLRSGRAVAVKVQRPGIRPRLVEDLEALEDIAEFLDRHTDLGRRHHFGLTVDEFRRSIFRELDYRQEARNLTTLKNNLKEFDRIVVPAPVDDYTTSRVLTMDFVEGYKITSISPATRLDIDGPKLADQLFRAYLQQMLVDGFMHADPHPGNIFLTPEGKVALLDLGMVLLLDTEFQRNLFELLLSISEGRSGDAASILVEVGRKEDAFDKATFTRRLAELVGRAQDAEVESLEIGRTLLDGARLSAECGLHFPTEITMVGQTLLKLDSAARVLAPEFRPNQSIRENAVRLYQGRMDGGFSLGKVFRGFAELREFLARLPDRANRILDSLAGHELELRVRAFDEGRLMEGIHKIANRITLGLLLAALIIGAALLMKIETSFRIFGYPGLAMLFFLTAAVGALVLAFNIAFRDEKRNRRNRP